MTTTSAPSRSFTDAEQSGRDAWTTDRMTNDCEGCEETYCGPESMWRPAQRCPVHGENFAAWWADLNAELDARWPGTWSR